MMTATMGSALLRILLCIACVDIAAVHGNIDNEFAAEPLYFTLMVSSTPTLNTSGVLSAVDQALNLVGNDTTLLPGYRLQHCGILDTQCNRTRAMELLSAELLAASASRRIVGVIGGGCSSASEGAVMASNGNIPMVSYASTSVALSDRSVFSNFFRTVPSDESLPPALATLMHYYGWKQLSILTEEEPQFLKLLPLLNASLSSASISVKGSVLFTAGDPTTSEAMDILDNSSRILFLNMNPRAAVFQLCIGHQRGVRYPRYVWITPGWYQQEWWSADKEYLLSLNCSSTDIEQQLSRSLVLLAHPNNGFHNISTLVNTDSYAKDAVMTLALALNSTLGNQSQLNLSDAIEATVFDGTSGNVRFDSSGNRQDSIVLLQQFRIDSDGSMSLYPVAQIEEHNFTYINDETNTTLWPDDTGIPPTILVVNFVIAPVYAYVTTVVAIGVALCVVCLLFNIIFRNRKVVKLTSPNLNYVIVFGAAMLMIGCIFVASPSEDVALFSIFCGIFSRIFLSLGYDICFVVALVKTIRVAYIFLKASAKKRIMKDWHLLALATGIIMIEILFTVPLLVLTQVNGINGILIRDINNPPHRNEQGYTVVSDILTCDSSSLYYLIYLGFVIIYKVVIHVIGLILAFLTRKVKIDPLNESKYSAAIIYCSTALLALGVVIIVFLATDHIIIYSGVWTSLVFVEVCVFLGLTFIPKAISLYRDPKGEKIFGKMTESSRTPHLPGSDVTASNKKKVTETQLTTDEVEGTGTNGVTEPKANNT